MTKSSENALKCMNIILAMDKNYQPAIPALVKSLFLNNPRENIHVYLIHDDTKPEDWEQVEYVCTRHLVRLIPIKVSAQQFANISLRDNVSYRFLDIQMLPSSLDRALLLSPDVLIINQIRSLYNLEMGKNCFAAAEPPGSSSMSTDRWHDFGAILLNLHRLRSECRDALIALDGNHTVLLDDTLYDYDSRRFETYQARSNGKINMDWVMRNTAILHFRGKKKPWLNSFRGRFGSLYKHYMQLATRRLPMAS